MSRPPFPKDPLSQHYHQLSRAWGNAQFDPAVNLIWAPKYVREFESSGKHFTRDSLYYARVLLDSGEPVAVERAGKIIDAVLVAQVTREGSPMRGNYPWFAEDGEKGTWDPNFSCFCSQALVEIWHWYRDALSEPQVAGIERALRLSAEFDLKRWVSPIYNNIALMTACSLACSGDLLGDKKFSEAGREKLRELCDCVNATGAFEEYNCPTYLGQNLRTLAAMMFFLDDDESQSRLRHLWRMQWRTALNHVHLPTAQLAGPYGRAYGRDIRRHVWGYCKFYLHRALGDAFPLGVDKDDNLHNLVPGWMIFDPDCPADLKKEFFAQKLPRTVVEVVDSRDFSVGLPESRWYPPLWRAEGSREKWRAVICSKGQVGKDFRGAVKRATAYHGEKFCLGSVNVEAAGQSAPLIAHWAHPNRWDKGNYLAALALSDKTKSGRLWSFDNAVMCHAQREGRVVGLMRFGLDGEKNPVRADAAHLAFQINRDAQPEILVSGKPHNGRFFVGDVVTMRAHGIVAGVRILAVEIPNIKTEGLIREQAALWSHEEGEMGVQLRLTPFSLELGQEAFVAFALEVAEESQIDALVKRLNDPRLGVKKLGNGRVKVLWGDDLSLDTSVRVMDYLSWFTPEGAVE